MPRAETVWQVQGDELPGISLKFIAGIQRLPNGNTVICNWLGHGQFGKAPHLVEITPGKQRRLVLRRSRHHEDHLQRPTPRSPRRRHPRRSLPLICRSADLRTAFVPEPTPQPHRSAGLRHGVHSRTPTATGSARIEAVAEPRQFVSKNCYNVAVPEAGAPMQSRYRFRNIAVPEAYGLSQPDLTMGG